MSRLPNPGGDAGNWGSILNDYLSQAHTAAGGLKANTVGPTQLASNAVNETALGVSGGTDGQVLTKDSTESGGFAWKNPGAATSVTMGGDISGQSNNASLADGVVGEAKLDVSNTPTSGQVLTYDGTGLTWTTVSGGGGGGAVTSVAGKTGAVTLVQGDVANLTADLAAKADDTAVVHDTGDETVAGVKTFSSSPIVPTPTTANQAASKSYVDSVAAAGAPDATSTTKGIVQLAGDLAGTAAAPVVSKVNGVTVTGTPTSGQVLKATSATAASWQADATGGGGGGGMINFTFRTVTANTTAVDGECLMVNTSAGAVTIVLPAPVANGFVRVKRRDANSAGNSIQVGAPSGSQLDNNHYGTQALNNPYQSADFWSDGVGWWQ